MKLIPLHGSHLVPADFGNVEIITTDKSSNNGENSKLGFYLETEIDSGVMYNLSVSGQIVKGSSCQITLSDETSCYSLLNTTKYFKLEQTFIVDKAPKLFFLTETKAKVSFTEFKIYDMEKNIAHSYALSMTDQGYEFKDVGQNRIIIPSVDVFATASQISNTHLDTDISRTDMIPKRNVINRSRFRNRGERLSQTKSNLENNQKKRIREKTQLPNIAPIPRRRERPQLRSPIQKEGRAKSEINKREIVATKRRERPQLRSQALKEKNEEKAKSEINKTEVVASKRREKPQLKSKEKAKSEINKTDVVSSRRRERPQLKSQILKEKKEDVKKEEKEVSIINKTEISTSRRRERPQLKSQILKEKMVEKEKEDNKVDPVKNQRHTNTKRSTSVTRKKGDGLNLIQPTFTRNRINYRIINSNVKPQKIKPDDLVIIITHRGSLETINNYISYYSCILPGAKIVLLLDDHNNLKQFNETNINYILYSSKTSEIAYSIALDKFPTNQVLCTNCVLPMGHLKELLTYNISQEMTGSFGEKLLYVYSGLSISKQTVNDRMLFLDTLEIKDIDQFIGRQDRVCTSIYLQNLLTGRKRIPQIYVSKCLKKFAPKIINEYNFYRYFDRHKPAIFFGCYNEDDFQTIVDHNPTQSRVVLWGGTDTNMQSEKMISYFSKSDDVYHLAISDAISNKLQDFGYKNVYRIELRLLNYYLYQQMQPRGTMVYIYTSPDPKRADDIYGQPIYNEVITRMKHLQFVLAYGQFTNEEIVNIYKKCFIGIRLTRFDGSANTVQELGMLGIRCVHNGQFPNSLAWNTADDVIDHIEKERKVVGTTEPEIRESMLRTIDTETSIQWLFSDFYDR